MKQAAVITDPEQLEKSLLLALETAEKLNKQWYHQPTQLYESEIAVKLVSDLGLKLG